LDDDYTQVGTLDYMAPEILVSHKSVYTEAVDVWALGVMVYEMLYGDPPFSGPDFESSCTNIIACDLCLTDDISEHAQDFLRRVLCKVRRGRSACVHHTRNPKRSPLPLQLDGAGDVHSAIGVVQ
jgi:calcium-dependent protein kinase